MKKKNLMMMLALFAALTCQAQARGAATGYNFMGVLAIILGLAAVVGVLAIIWLLVIMLYKKVKSDKK